MRRALLSLLLLLCFAAASRAQWPYVPIQQSMSKSSNVASITCVFDNNVTSGNLVLVGFSWFSSTNTPTVSDTRSSSYTQNLFNTSNTERVGVYSATLGSSGANTVTVAITGASFMNVMCIELPPLWTLTVDVSAVSTFSGTPATVTTPSITTTLNSDLVFAFTGNDNSAGRQSLQTASLGTWYQVSSSGGADSQAGFIRVAGVAGAGNNVTLNNGGTSGTLVSIAFKSNALAITSATAAPDGATSNAYDWTALAAGGNAAYTWSVSSGALPTGLTIDSSTGRITGTPTVSNNYTATLQATDGTTTATKSITFKIATSLNTIAALQVKGIASSTGTSPLAFTSNVTSGSLLVANIGYAATLSQINYCTDTLGTSFKLIGAMEFDGGASPVSSSTIGGILTLAGIAPSGGADTVSCTATSAGGSGGFMISIGEFSNVQYFANDNFVFTRGTNASPATITSSNLTTLVPNELLWGACTGYTSASTNTVNSPFTQVGTALGFTSGYNFSTSVTTYALACAQASNTSTAWMISMAGFRPSGATVVPPVPKGFPQVVKYRRQRREGIHAAVIAVGHRASAP